METFKLENDIKTFFVTAKSFPDGALEAHQKLHSLVPFSKERKYFGISRPENGQGIVYKACAEELTKGEAKKFGCETFVIKKGEYISIVVKNYTKDIQSVFQAFQKLTARPDIDPQGYCVEWYLNDNDVRCMIKLADGEIKNARQG
jgi:predicted transcriptional regulator YdeE